MNESAGSGGAALDRTTGMSAGELTHIVAPEDAVRIAGESAIGSPILAKGPDGAYHLQGSCCRICGKFQFPAAVLCPQHLEPTAPALLSDAGIVYAGVRVDLAPSGFEAMAPYWAAYVDLPDHEVRVFAPLDYGDLVPAHGDHVLLAPTILPNGVFAPSYRPAPR
jgi:hypothetical protein